MPKNAPYHKNFRITNDNLLIQWNKKLHNRNIFDKNNNLKTKWQLTRILSLKTYKHFHFKVDGSSVIRIDKEQH